MSATAASPADVDRAADPGSDVHGSTLLRRADAPCHASGEDDTELAPADGGTRFGEGAADAEPELTGIPRVGSVVAGKYRVDAIVGLGGMGVVLAVTHTSIGQRYAMKCLLPRGANDPETIARFRREAQAAARIKSEHVARVSDFGELDSGAPYLLMEYLPGRDLGAVLERVGRLSIRDAVEYVLQACAGIAEAHALGIVHRDLKPSNLFLTQRLDGAALVKVLDFGISKAMDRDIAPMSATLTQTTSVFGSPAYMSPEQLRSTKNVDYRADIWGLGVILYELLTGTTPFKAETGGGLLAAIAADPPDSLREHRPDVSEELEAVVMRCLEKNVNRRWQRVSDLALALEPFRSERSLVSIDRIVRLSGAPAPPLRELEPLGGRASSSSMLSGLGSATEGPVTTGVRAPTANSGLTRAALVFAGVATALACVAAVLLRGPSGAPTSAGNLATSELAVSAPASTAPPAGPSASSVAAEATAPLTTSPAAASPAAATAASARPRPGATAAPVGSARGGGKPRGVVGAAASARASGDAKPSASAPSASAPGVTAPGVTAPAPERPRDPTEDSH